MIMQKSSRCVSDITPRSAVGATLALHRPGAEGIKKSHHEKKKGDPWYLWSGLGRTEYQRP
ncbi:MAG: hypothetical protein ACI8W8_001855 [Rhodothermales bacterium]|jgi:hypothetical protein